MDNNGGNNLSNPDEKLLDKAFSLATEAAGKKLYKMQLAYLKTVGEIQQNNAEYISEREQREGYSYAPSLSIITPLATFHNPGTSDTLIEYKMTAQDQVKFQAASVSMAEAEKALKITAERVADDFANGATDTKATQKYIDEKLSELEDKIAEKATKAYRASHPPFSPFTVMQSGQDIILKATCSGKGALDNLVSLIRSGTWKNEGDKSVPKVWRNGKVIKIINPPSELRKILLEDISPSEQKGR